MHLIRVDVTWILTGTCHLNTVQISIVDRNKYSSHVTWSGVFLHSQSWERLGDKIVPSYFLVKYLPNDWWGRHGQWSKFPLGDAVWADF